LRLDFLALALDFACCLGLHIGEFLLKLFHDSFARLQLARGAADISWTICSSFSRPATSSGAATSAAPVRPAPSFEFRALVLESGLFLFQFGDPRRSSLT
jgi:hypothetical protein